ncbi:MAG: choice-of-anchor J domain-containing protein [Phycisphaerales bacterium]
MPLRFRPFVSALAVSTLAASGVLAQAQFSEEFENLGEVQPGQHGPASLASRGWIFRNQSSQLSGFPAWSATAASGWPNSGAGFLRGSSSAVGGFVGQQMSQWAILPPVPNMRGGDTFSIWVLDGAHAVNTYLDIRYSPTGGTSTGAGAAGIGDFTQVLYSGELPISTGPFTYTQVTFPMPGSGPISGRLAIRFHAPNMHAVGGATANLYLDSLTIGAPPGPPCGLDVPEPGETVIWNAAGSPYTICQDVIIRAGATLEIGPGAQVLFNDGRELYVEGTLRVRGTAGLPATITGNEVTGLRVYGSASLEHADLDASVLVHEGGSFEASDSVLRDRTRCSGRPTSFVRLDRCEVRCEVTSFFGSAVINDVAVTHPQTFVTFGGFWNIGSLESASPILFTASLQDRTIEHVTVTDVAGAPALELHATGGAVDFLLGPGNVLTGNQYPVWPRFTGLLPDSTIPVTGNINNAILGVVHANAALRSRVSLPDFGIPYHFLERARVTGDVRVEPGAILKFGPSGGLTVVGDNGTDGTLRGLPGQPLVFERLDPALPWLSLATGPGWQIFEHLDIRGAGVGVVGNEAELWLRDSVIRGCAIGAHPAADGNIYGSGVEFYANALALRDDVSNPAGQIKTGIHFSGDERPNIFEGNTLAARNFGGGLTGQHHPFPVDNNWWGHETGPFEPLFHPAGQGDEISPFIDFQPFLAQRPDLSDARPVVRLKTRIHPVVLPGEKIIIEWEAFDDGALTSFDVVILDPDINLPAGFFFLPLAQNLPGTQRSFEVQVPVVGLHPYDRFPIRIIARDDAGNSSFEQFWVTIPHQTPAADVTFQTPLVEFRGGEHVEFCYVANGLSSSSPQIYVESAADDRISLQGGGPPGGCAFGPVIMPHASSDRVRIGLRAQDNFNRDEWYFTDYFTIRPDPRIGDAPPQIELTAPSDGQTFAGGTTIPIQWTASDDQGLREFRLQASFNRGYTYHTIESSIPPGARSYDWHLPASTGIDELRLRIVAVDTTMQNSSSGDDRRYAILPGEPNTCRADFNADGALDPDDLGDYINCYFAQPPCGAADFNADGVSNPDDLGDYINAYFAGCP